ncbi:MAG: lipopolysaccharide biosynthesis protein [Gaiellaceae bacterium]
MSRLFVRRSATAIGIYSSFLFGIAGTIVATRELPSRAAFGTYATVLFTTGFVQSFFDLTMEEALVKYGFRYLTRERFGRLRGLFAAGLRVKLTGSALGTIGILVFASFASHSLRVPLLIAAAIPLGQSLEGLAGIPLYLHGRYDLRAAFQSWGMLLRLAGVAVGARYGVSETVAGVLAAQLVSTASIGIAGTRAFRRFPAEPREALGDDRGGIVRFVMQSSVATGVISLRTGLAPLLLGAAAGQLQVGYLKVAQAPQTAFGTLSAPIRMVLLTEQTSDWERGRQSVVLRGVRRFTLAAFLLSLVAVPLLWIWMPDLIRFVNGARWVPAASAARLFVVTAAVQLVVGWSKPFPVSIGRPGLRVWTHGFEAILVLALVVPFSIFWGAAGAAGAILAGMVAYAIAWIVIFVRIVPEDGAPGLAADRGGEAEIEAEAGILAR